MIGTTVGSYRIEEKIGEGGMGTVYRAIETNLDRPVAIKVLNTDLARNPSIVERFRAEARAQANLNHTNIATLYTFLVDQGNAMMVMEYVEGENFQDMVNRRGPIPSQEAIPLFRQALLGIGAAHRMGIVHRDIKPSNLMLNKNGIVKVMDFGIAKVVGGDRGLTRTGVQVGTVYYMSPEQVKSEPVDIRSDIYALGVTLYEMLTAHVPFGANSEFQVLSDHVHTPPPLPTRFYPYIPKGVENIVLKALEKKPDDRFQTVEEFGAALERPEQWESYVPKAGAAVIGGALAGAAAASSLAAANAATAEMSAPAALGAKAATPPPVAAVAATPAPAAAFWTKPRKGVAAGAGALVALVLGYAALRPAPPPPPPPAPSHNTTPETPKTSGDNTLRPIVTDTPDAPGTNPFESNNEPRKPKRTTPDPPPARKVVPRTNDNDDPPSQPDQPDRPVQPPQPPQPPPEQPRRLTPSTPRVIPAATQITVRLIAAIDGSHAEPGQVFTASVDSPVIVDGQVVVPRGSNAQVRVVQVSKAGRFRGSAKMEIDLASLTVGGRRYQVQSGVFEATGAGRGKRTGTFAIIGGAVGAAVGGAVHGAKGAVEGGGAGAGAGAGTAAVTGDTGVKLPSETRLNFRLAAPLTLNAG